jgi:hypothetical protein
MHGSDRDSDRIRAENLDWSNRLIFVPYSKTPEGRRVIPMSDRVHALLRTRVAGREQVGCFRRSERSVAI